MLHKKIAFVAGASAGISELVARRYAKEGAHVILADKSIESLERVYDLIRDDGGKATIAALDLTDPQKVADVAKQLNLNFHKIDILVGADLMIGELRPITDYSIATWDSIVSANISANWYLIRYFDPLLKTAPDPRVIFITSDIVSRSENFFYGPYAASKAALESLVSTYANENKQSSLRTNLVEIPLRSDKPEHDLKADNEADHNAHTQLFVILASQGCKLTGKKHLIRY